MSESRQRSARTEWIQRFKQSEAYYLAAPVIGILALFLLGGAYAPSILTLPSIISLLSMAAILLCACMGQEMVMLIGGIDLSITPFLVLGAAWGGALSGGTTLGVLRSLLIVGSLSAVLGFISGITIVGLRIPAMVATLSVGRLVSSTYLAVTGGKPSGNLAPILKTIGTGSLFGIRYLLLIAIFLTVAMYFVLNKTRFGKSLFLIGTNLNAAELAGVKVARIRVLVYVAAALCSMLSGYLMVGFVGSIQNDMAAQYTMYSIAAVVVGGTSITGGRGTFTGSALGAVFIILLSNILSIVEMAEGYKMFIQGAVLMTILVLYSREKKLKQ